MDQSNIAIFVALFSFAGTVIGALFVFFGKRGESIVTRSNSVDVQEAQIRAELRQDNTNLKARDVEREKLLRELERNNEALENKNVILEKQVKEYKEERVILVAKVRTLEMQVQALLIQVGRLTAGIKEDGGEPTLDLGGGR